jgi:L-ectoine synthase
VFVRTREDVRASGHELQVAAGAVTTVRYLNKSDGLGFSFSDVYIPAGHEAKLWYKHQWEANFVVSGLGEVEEVATGRRWPLEPGTMYVVGPEDRHVIRAAEDVHLVSVFNPPIVGNEIHDEDGSFPPTGPLPPGPSA